MKGKSIYFFYIFSTIFLGLIFLIHLGGSNSWAQTHPPYIYEDNCLPEINEDPNTPTVVNSLEKIEIYFYCFPNVRMENDTTKAAFHLYIEGEGNDLRGNGNLSLTDYIVDSIIGGSILTFDPDPNFSFLKGITYEVKIEHTAEDINEVKFDGDGDGTGGEDPEDDWVMRFKIDANAPETGWSDVYDPNGIFSGDDKVSGMIVDSQDWLWVVSEEGDICYFDGNNWNCETSFGDVEGIPCMAVDNQGFLWVAINGVDGPKLGKLRSDGEWDIKTLGISDKFIKDIAVDSKNNIWIIASDDTSNDIYKYDEQLAPSNPGGNGPVSEFITFLVIDLNDNLWVRTVFSKIWKAEVDWGDEYTEECNYFDDIDIINDMVADSEGNIWIGTDSGLLKLDPSGQDPNWSQYTNNGGLLANSINTLRIDPNNNFIWVGTSNGLWKFNIGDEENWEAYTETSSKVINHLALNSRGEVWFSMNQGIQMRDEISPSVLKNECIPSSESDKPFIGISQNIQIVFSEPMKHELAESAFTMVEYEDEHEWPAIGGAFSWLNSHTLCFDPNANAITENYTYKVDIDTNAVDLLGNSLKESYSVVFSVGEQELPYVGHEKTCTLSLLIFYVKDDGVGVDPNLIEVTVKVKDTGQDVPGKIDKIDMDNNDKIYQVIFNPNEDFTEDIDLTVTVTAEDLYGNLLLEEDREFSITPQNPNIPGPEPSAEIPIDLSGSGCFLDTLTRTSRNQKGFKIFYYKNHEIQN